MGRRTRADDFDDVPNDTFSGSLGAAGNESQLSTTLLDVTADLTRLSVLLLEASADDWKELRPRITALRAAVKMLPSRPPKKNKVGF